jgi:eukaryotic-like serine/threonine-protein kinase
MAETWKQWEGTIIDGKFRLERMLGGSEHSVVFLTETESGTKAAIKFVPAIPQSLAFQRASWEQASRLSHPNLIRLFGTGKCRLGNLDLVYAVMEYAEENVAQILPNRALSPEETREMLAPVLAGLKYLHEKGLAHGSLKPTNILAVQDQLKLSSDQVRAFGNPGLALDGSAYAAPEISSAGAEAASDSWSLGATLVEVLTQRPPDKPTSGQPVVPASMPEPYREIASRCLEIKPQDRWSLSQIDERLAGKAPKPASATASRMSDSVPPSSGTDTPMSESVPAELGSGRRLLVSGISFLLILVAIYFGSQFLHHGARENESAPAPAPSPAAESPNSSPQPASQPTAAPSPTAETPAPATTAPAEGTTASSPGRVLERAAPNVSAAARNTITGKVRVRVNLAVDESGKVSDARFITPGPSRYFASHAMDAARKWSFVPPQVNGQPAPSKWTLSFTFTRKGVDASAEQSSP